MTKSPPHGQSLVVAPAHEAETAAAPAALAAGAGVTLHDLFQMHAAYVWNSLRRLGISGADIEDVTHDVFVQVHAHLGEFDPSRPVRPWLFGFAFRLASQYRRRAHRRREMHGEPDLAAHPGAAADEQIAADDDRKLVLAALDAIDLERRAVFVLYEIDREPMAAIAASLGIPVNTAYSRLRAARAEFRAAVTRLRLRRGGRAPEEGRSL
jgi:RNA polymerase sigma-70 factor (ECF subfamily)